MKRILISSFALIAMALAPAASFGRHRDDDGDDRGQRDYRSSYTAQDRYYGGDSGYYNQRTWQPPREYSNGYDRYAYGDEHRDRVGRSAAYIGGGAAAGAAIGAIIGHGKGAGIGALAGAAGGYLYQRHNDRKYGNPY